MRNKKKSVDVRPRETRANLRDCASVETILVAHERQKIISELELEQMFLPLNIIGRQNNLKMQFYRSETPTQQKFVIKYDVLSMIKALDILERSVMEN